MLTISPLLLHEELIIIFGEKLWFGGSWELQQQGCTLTIKNREHHCRWRAAAVLAACKHLHSYRFKSTWGESLHSFFFFFFCLSLLLITELAAHHLYVHLDLSRTFTYKSKMRAPAIT